jgi:hypothetical protein
LGIFKKNVYALAVDTAEELLQHVQNACTLVHSTGIFQHISIQAEACVTVQGQHLEYLF